MKDFKSIILDALNSIEWIYEKNAEGEYDPYALYKGSKCEIENVFHKAFADSLIEWRKERMSNWKNWVTTGTLITPAGVPSPFVGTSSCSQITNPNDLNLAYTMRDAFRMEDPNMKFSHLKVFTAIHDWLGATSLMIFVDGSGNLAMNTAPVFIDANMLLLYANALEGELTIASQKEGFSKEDYWEIFGRYLDLGLTSSVQIPVVMGGMFNGNTLSPGMCTVIL